MAETKWKVENGVAVITLNRPPANALARSVMDELEDHFEKVYNDESIKCVVIHGEGRFFAAGADIKEFIDVEDGHEFAELGKKGQDTFFKIENAPKPVIAAIHGAALGGGLELAMACHIRIAAEGTKLGLPELNLGLIPGFGGTQRLPKLIGKAKALELMLTSKSIKAEEALMFGLINQVSKEEELLKDVMTIATNIAAKSPLTVRRTLELVATSDGHHEEGFTKELECFGEVYMQDDRKEGVQAFLEKREPRFQGN